MKKLKPYLAPTAYYLALVAGILAISFLGRPADAQGDDQYTPDHLREGSSPWNSGTLDALGGHPSGYDGSADYILEYTEERARMRQEELLDAIEEAKDE